MTVHVATPLSADVPVVIGTTRDEAMLTLGGDDHVERCFLCRLHSLARGAAGMDAYLSKPLQPDQFFDVILTFW